jgi:hypothetical protein
VRIRVKYLAVTPPIILLSHSTKISDIPLQHKINFKLSVLLITSEGPLHSPPSSDCKLLNLISLKELGVVAIRDVFSLLQPNAVLVALEAVYTLCPRVDDGVHCSSPLSFIRSGILSY